MPIRWAGIVWMALLAACGSPPSSAPTKIALPVVAKPLDESRRFPPRNQVRIELVEQKLLGKDFLPGGNLAEYRRGGKAYRQFLARAATPDKAALLLFDLKNTLSDARFIPHMGGFFGKDGDQPVYVFQKGVFLAGYVGLAEKDAESLAREFAMRLN